MKRILITGANSYVGTSFEAHLKQWEEKYRTETIDMVDTSWRDRSFRGYDAVFHVAGIVHQKDKKNEPDTVALYDRVNRQLAVETAQKAKADGVKQFIFMSTASVYGLTAGVGQQILINRDTPVCPVDPYGASKAKAEEEILALADENFRVAIVRAPMIYGKGCKGNYTTLSTLARKLPVFPMVENQRSMLYIDNLSEHIRLLVEDAAEGIFWPQNREYVNTSELVNLIAHTHGKNILLVKGFGWALKLVHGITDMADKAFGSLCYDYALSAYPKDYCIKNFYESVAETESD